MMVYTSHFLLCYFPSSDNKTFVYLPRISRNYLSVEAFRQLHAKRAFTRGRGSHDNKDFLFLAHVRVLLPRLPGWQSGSGGPSYLAYVVHCKRSLEYCRDGTAVVAGHRVML